MLQNYAETAEDLRGQIENVTSISHHMPMVLDDLRERRESILNVAAEYGASNVRVFGSVANGEAEPDSDVDLLVDWGSKRQAWDSVRLTRELSSLLGCKVDILTPPALHWYIKDRVLKEARSL